MLFHPHRKRSAPPSPPVSKVKQSPSSFILIWSSPNGGQHRFQPVTFVHVKCNSYWLVHSAVVPLCRTADSLVWTFHETWKFDSEECWSNIAFQLFLKLRGCYHNQACSSWKSRMQYCRMKIVDSALYELDIKISAVRGGRFLWKFWLKYTLLTITTYYTLLIPGLTALTQTASADRDFAVPACQWLQDWSISNFRICQPTAAPGGVARNVKESERAKICWRQFGIGAFANRTAAILLA